MKAKVKQTKKKAVTIYPMPPKPTKDDREVLDSYFYLPAWEFKGLFLTSCSKIDEHFYIGEEYPSKTELKMDVYCFRGTDNDPSKPNVTIHIISGFFIRYLNRVYQARSLSNIQYIEKALIKELNWGNYIIKQAEEKRRLNEKS